MVNNGCPCVQGCPKRTATCKVDSSCQEFIEYEKARMDRYEERQQCGVAMVGRPVARYFDDGLTLEVNRCCTDGTKNACSMLYGYAWRAARGLGYKRLVTYTRQSENGASLRASGWHCDGEAGGTHWTGERYIQQEIVLDEMKVRWSKEDTE